jgi:hypothetical protein
MSPLAYVEIMYCSYVEMIIVLWYLSLEIDCFGCKADTVTVRLVLHVVLT